MNATRRTRLPGVGHGLGARRLRLALVAGCLSVLLLLPSSVLAAPREPQPPASPEAPSREPTINRPVQPRAMHLPGAPPEVGDLIVEDPLDAPGLFSGPLACPSGRNIGEFVGEGYILKVTGRCRDGIGTFMFTPSMPQLSLPDGEVRVEAKVVSGHDRAVLVMVFRAQADRPGGYVLFLHPSGAAAALTREIGSTQTTLAMRTDLAGRVSRNGWNTIAVRLDGPNIWVLVNDEPILSAPDTELDDGRVGFGLLRLGTPDDNAESAVVFRNLRVSRLDPER